jgi:tetratricopeptide (TPR) repeat protein
MSQSHHLHQLTFESKDTQFIWESALASLESTTLFQHTFLIDHLAKFNQESLNSLLLEITASIETNILCTPLYITLHYVLFTILNELGENPETVDQYNECIDLLNTFENSFDNIVYESLKAHFHSLRGLWYLFKSEDENAISDFNQALDLRTYSHAYYNRGICHFSSNPEKALLDYLKFLEFEPNDPWAHRQLGHVYQKLSQDERAIHHYTRAIELNSTFSTAYNERGLSYLALYDYENAFSDFTKAIDIDPNFGFSYYNRSLIYSTKEQYIHALREAYIASCLCEDEDDEDYVEKVGYLAGFLSATSADKLFEELEE